MVECLGNAVLRHWGKSPHGFQLTLARSVLALSTLITLALNDTTTLLHSPAAPDISPSSCAGLAQWGAFCLAPDAAEAVRWALLAMTFPALLGFLPAVSAPLHAYVAFTVFSNTVGIEGGDYLVGTLTVLLSVMCLTDVRVNAWRPRADGRKRLQHIPANVALVVVQVQIAYIYIEAATVKQAHPIWSEGSALWYWVQQPSFGARPEVRDALQGLFMEPVILQMATWGVIITEYVLAFAVLASRARWARLSTLALSVTLHLAFALVLGLVTFGLSMLGALLLVSWRSKDAMPWQLFRRLLKGRPTSRLSLEVVR